MDTEAVWIFCISCSLTSADLAKLGRFVHTSVFVRFGNRKPQFAGVGVPAFLSELLALMASTRRP